MTDKNGKEPIGWIFYDAECALCLRWLRRTERLLNRRNFKFVPLQTTWAKERLGLTPATALAEMRLMRADGRIFGGADAVMEIARKIWWAWPAWMMSKIPGVILFCRAIYRFIANNRHCANNACAATNRKTWMDWIPLALLPIAAFTLRDFLPAWVFMWVFVTAFFFGCKWLTWRRAQVKISTAGHVRSLGYLFAWPGMDAKKILTEKYERKPKAAEWFLATGRFFAGAGLIWLAAKTALTTESIANAWIAMFGLTLILHFGLFHLVALVWQRAGVAAEPLMKSPLSATSLSDFWGARWNTAFNKLVYDLAFRPLARRAGIVWATLGVFAISGVIHELAISVPARGGYGLPFAYFLLQGVGVLFERSNTGCALGLGRGARGWWFVFTLTAAPAYWLFHPVFVRNVILPMLQTIGAT
ncbi:MAG: DCC1-like thiol-disulfide oxidoreductase family protein [Verrucomicrobiota bacterium]